MDSRCSFFGCHRYGRKESGLCSRHDSDNPQPEETQYCSVSECRCVLYAKGMCHTHYGRQRRGKPLTGKIRKRTSENEVDIFPKCRCGLRLYTAEEREQKSCNDCLPDNLADFMRTRMRAEGY